MAIYITSIGHVRLFAITQKTLGHHKLLYCFLCKRKNCHHGKEEISEEIPDGFEFDFDNDFEDDENGENRRPNDLDDLVSTANYPCKFFLDSILRI